MAKSKNKLVQKENAAASLRALRAAYGEWRKILGDRSSYSNERFCNVIHASVSFTGTNCPDLNTAHKIHNTLTRGVELLSNALSWDQPVVGDSASPSSYLRGLQWKSVIAWSGLEQIIAYLCRSTKAEELKRVFDLLDSQTYAGLSSPSDKLKVLVKWRDRDTGEDKTGITGFLDTNKDSSRAIRNWLVEGREIETWHDAMFLAKVFRHASAHGALSAAKIKEWGLAPAFEQLVPEMGLIAATIFSRIVRECQSKLTSDELPQSAPKLDYALCLAQPHAEAILRGKKKYEIRTKSTKNLGKIYIYASSNREHDELETAQLREFGLVDTSPDRLHRGLVLGTVELCECQALDGLYHWHFRNPDRWNRPKLPKNKPRGVWFKPF